MKNSYFNYFLVAIGVAVAFFIGYSAKKNEEAIYHAAGKLAVDQSVNYLKNEVNVTKNWFNQLKNQIKQIWS